MLSGRICVVGSYNVLGLALHWCEENARIWFRRQLKQRERKEEKRRELTEETRKVLIHLADVALKGRGNKGLPLRRALGLGSRGSRCLSQPLSSFREKQKTGYRQMNQSSATWHTILSLSQRIMTGLFSQEKL